MILLNNKVGFFNNEIQSKWGIFCTVSDHKSSNFFLETRKKVEHFAVAHPYIFAVGVALPQVCFMEIVERFLEISAPPSDAIRKSTADYVTLCKKIPIMVIVIGPCLEELIFRGVVQPCIRIATGRVMELCQINPAEEVDFLVCKIKRANLISVLATSLLFGFSHLSNGTGISQAVTATIGGIVRGLLKEKLGLRISIASHMAIGALCWTSLFFTARYNGSSSF